MKLLKTAALLAGWVFFLVGGIVVYALTMTSDTLLAIYKVWK